MSEDMKLLIKLLKHKKDDIQSATGLYPDDYNDGIVKGRITGIDEVLDLIEDIFGDKENEQ